MLSLQLIFIAVFVCFSQLCISQGVRGRLTDAQNNPVPYAAIYDETSFNGTTSNADGYYELKLQPGKKSLVYKSMGYFVERRTVDISSGFITINIQLKEQAYELKDVVVTPGKEDPAYAIMRKVIGLAPYHLNQVREYSADVYLRGSIHIIRIPKIIEKRIEVNGKKGVIKSGNVYLEESINQIDFKAPDKYNQKVKSYRSNFPGENSVSPMQIIRASFYQPNIEGVISPLASNAFNYYKYRYEGYFREGEYTIFKIKVTPKRNSQQLMSGYIFIIDNVWCLHSVDVSHEMFFGKLEYKEMFSPVKGNAWLPISYVFYVNAAIMGIKADYKYTSSVKYQMVQLNEKVSKPVKVVIEDKVKQETKVSSKKLKSQQEIERLLTKEELNNREMIKLAGLMAKESKQDSVESKSLEIKDEVNTNVTIEKDAMKKDTAFWNTARPIPLTKIESGLSDSIKIPKSDTLIKKDTTSSKTKKTIDKVGKFVFGGAAFYMFDSTFRIRYDGLLGFNKFDFNTVDGFVYKQTFNTNVKVDSSHNLKINPGAAYAFSRKSFMWWANTEYEYAPMRGGNIKLSYSKTSTDYNQNDGMNNYVNAIASLFFRRNYKKLYEEHQVNLTNKIDIANGFNISANIGFRELKVLQNHSDYSFFYRKTREYWPNNHVGDTEALQNNSDNKEAYFKIGLEYTPKYYYKVARGKKHYQYSKYPTFFTTYRKAVPEIFNSSADYDFLEIGARQKKEWGMMHSFSWNLTVGKYLSKKRIYLSNYRFFNNQPLPVVFGRTENAFYIPGVYDNFSNDTFAEGHITFTTPYLLLKYLPFISNKIWLENLHLNFLNTNEPNRYWEAGYSLSQIYAVGGVGVFAGFQGNNFQSAGIRIFIGI